MADTFITQCPHCGTSFRVKDDQLAVANGSVRCGACLQVFSARNHVVNGKPAPKRSAAKAAETPGRQSAKRPGATQKTQPKKAAPPARKQRIEPPPMESEFEPDKDDDADFIFADDPGDDDEFIFQDSDDDLFSSNEDDSELGELSDSFINLNGPQPDKQQANPFRHETQSIERELFDDSEEEDESWAESILDELEREEKQKQTPRFEAREPAPGRSGERQKARHAEHRPPAEEVPEPAMQARAEPSMGSRASQLVRQLNHDIDLDFNVEERLARWRWLGGLLAVVLLLTLAAQIAWLQKDTYAKMDQWRGLYESACNVLGCSLPAQEDLGQIRASNVLVRDHKVLDDVKLLDAILTNRAPFKQPFPVLVLQYTNVNGDLVADQAFHPDDYLRGEMTGARLMPINTRVYVSIPLRDPGERAVNYQLLLTAPS